YLLGYIDQNHLKTMYPSIVTAYRGGGGTRVGKLYDDYWHTVNINPPLDVTPATIARANQAFYQEAAPFGSGRVGESYSCYDVTTSLVLKYTAALKKASPAPGPISKINIPVIPGTKTSPQNDRILYTNPAALDDAISQIKTTLAQGYPVICGVMSGHDQVRP